jgi:polyisoprenoid-binding protein YceI
MNIQTLLSIYWFRSGILFCCVLMMTLPDLVAQSQSGPRNMPVVVDASSRLWLDGTSNVIDFSCITTNLVVDGTIIGLDTTLTTPARHDGIQIEVRIPVMDMDCGRAGINKDMRQTLDVRNHRNITYKLGENRLVGGTTDENGAPTFQIATTGTLTIAGKTRTEEIKVTGQLLENWRFRIRGSHAIHLTDYDISPPAPMMGLIRVEERMVVHFDVILKLQK